MQTRHAYLIHRTDPGRDDDRRVMSLGTLALGADTDVAAVARELLDENRAAHSYYDGPRRCWVWPIGDDEAVPRTPPVGVEPVDG